MAGRHLSTPDDPAFREEEHDDAVGSGEHLVSPGAIISDDTSITVDLEAMEEHPEVEPSPARPDRLVQGGAVGDGTELE